jgi:hypothetical protein
MISTRPTAYSTVRTERSCEKLNFSMTRFRPALCRFEGDGGMGRRDSGAPPIGSAPNARPATGHGPSRSPHAAHDNIVVIHLRQISGQHVSLREGNREKKYLASASFCVL